jgi:acyl-coenzyme A thioesterase PaaI-like protein
VTAYGDICMALAAHTLFNCGEYLSTSSITVNFLAPVTEGPVLGEGTVIRRGRSTVFLEAALRSAAGAEYARASSVGAVRRLQE